MGVVDDFDVKGKQQLQQEMQSRILMLTGLAVTFWKSKVRNRGPVLQE